MKVYEERDIFLKKCQHKHTDYGLNEDTKCNCGLLKRKKNNQSTEISSRKKENVKKKTIR